MSQRLALNKLTADFMSGMLEACGLFLFDGDRLDCISKI